MAWAAVTADGRSLLVFINRGVKIHAENYRENVLKTVLKPWADKYFGCRSWTFQQDATPPHSVPGKQEWLKKEVPHFISIAQWPIKIKKKVSIILTQRFDGPLSCSM